MRYLLALAALVACQAPAERPPPPVAADAERFAAGYPALMARLENESPTERIAALRAIGATGETDAIPVLIPLVLPEEPGGDLGVRAWSAAALRDIVATTELKRRDPAHPESILLLPRTKADADLRFLAPVVNQMTWHDELDPSVLSAGATMAGYIGLHQFRGRLAAMGESPHPAVQDAARFALELLDSSPGPGQPMESKDRAE